jgi:hypothetical protein
MASVTLNCSRIMFNDFVIIEDCNMPGLPEDDNFHSRTQAPKKRLKRSIDRLTFRVPTRFRTDVQKCLDNKQPLNQNQYSAVARSIGDEIEKQTICPDCESLQYAVSMVLDRHPNLIVGSSKENPIFVII